MTVYWQKSGSRPGEAARFHRACGCTMQADRFLAMLDSFHWRAESDWTRVGRLTHPLHWTCGAETFQHALRLTYQAEEATDAARGAPPSPVALRTRKPVASTGEGPDLVLLGGKIFTADPARPWADSLAIEQGRISAVGVREEVEPLAGDRTMVIELGDRLVIPGFNDAHMHHTPDPAGVRLPIDPVADPDFWEIAPFIEDAVHQTPPGTWIYGVMGETLINDGTLDRRLLDQLAPEHPIILLGLTNHTNVVNSAAMRRLGLAENEPDPLGGFFERLPGTHILSGRINEYAQWGPQRCFASMATIAEGAASLGALAADCLALGITTIQNMSWTPAARYLEMLEAADVPIKVRLIRFPPAGPEGRLLSEGKGLAPRADRVSIHGTKWILDGTTVERAASLGRPYADRPDIKGRTNFDRLEVQEMLREAVLAGDQLLLHAIGTETVEMVLQVAEAAALPSASPLALRIEHGDGLTPDQVRRTKALGIMVVQNPSHFLFPEIYGPRFGANEPFAAFRSLVESGIPMAIGSDGPLNPFLGLFAAVVHPARPAEACSLDTALAAYTSGGASAEGKGDRKGRIRPGYEADLAVLSQDIFAVAPERFVDTRSLLTIVDGKIAFEGCALV